MRRRPIRAAVAPGILVVLGLLSGLGAWIVAAQCVDYADYLRVVGTVPLPSHPVEVEFRAGLCFVACGDSGLQVVDVSEPTHPTRLGDLVPSGGVLDLAVAGDQAYLATDAFGLAIADVSDPASPTLVGTVDFPYAVRRVWVFERYAYMADTQSNLVILDIAEPETPKIVGLVAFPEVVWDLARTGAWAYATGGEVNHSGGDLYVLDMSDPARPEIVNTIVAAAPARAVSVCGSVACLALGNSGLQSFDVSDPASPVPLGTLQWSGFARDVRCDDGLAWVSTGAEGLWSIDITSPESPRILGVVGTAAQSATVSGAYAYVADWFGSLFIADVSTPESVPVQGSVALPFPVTSVEQAFGYAYVGTLSGYGFEGRLHVIDARDPASPEVVTEVDTWDGVTDLALAGGFAYVSDSGNYLDGSLHVVDIAVPEQAHRVGLLAIDGGVASVAVSGNLVLACASANPWAPTHVQAIDVSSSTSPTIVGTLPLSMHARRIAMSGMRAYVVGATRLDVLDVSIPESPTLLGSHTFSPASCQDVAVSGNLVVVSIGPAVVMLDVSDPTAPTPLSTVAVPGNGRSVTIAGPLVYVGLSDDGVFVVDISDPTRPQYQGTASRPKSVLNLAVDDGHAYVGDASGLHVIPSHCRLAVSTPTLGLHAVPRHDRVVLSWSTLRTDDCAGFRVYRSGFPASDFRSLCDELIAGPPPYSFVDRAVLGGLTYTYRVGAVDFGGREALGPQVSVTVPAAGSAPRLGPPTPSPFREETTLSFTLESVTPVRLAIFDVGGRLVRVLVDATLAEGEHRTTWDGTNQSGRHVAAGTYFARLVAAESPSTRPVVFLGEE